MDTSIKPRIFLGLNAAFSILSGLSLLLTTGLVGGLLFAETAEWHGIALRLLGAGLIIFGIDLILMSTNSLISKGEIMLITAMDVGWIIGSALLLAVYGNLFSSDGKVAIIIVAFFVAVFAIGQYLGARNIVPPTSKATVQSARGGRFFAKVSRSVTAPKDVVWRVMTDHPRYADVADNISKVEVVSGDGIGMQRRCYGPKGEDWLETCDLFDEGRAFGFRIHTEANDYPYPVSELHGEWSVEPDGNGSRFRIDIEATTKGGSLKQALFMFVAKRQFKAVLVRLADAWADRMEREAQARA